MDNTHLITNRMGRQYWMYNGDKLYEQRFARENGPYQVRNLRFIRRMCPNANTIIDIGTNIGNNVIEYSTWAKKVIGFEPYEPTFKLAELNIKHNKERKIVGRYYNTKKREYEYDSEIQDGWWKIDNKFASLDMIAEIVLYNIALGNSEGNIKMLNHKFNAGHNCVLQENVKSNKEIFNAEMKKLDSFNINNVDAIKIDVEGYEYFVVQGACNTIRKNRPIVQVEIVENNYKRYNYKPQDLLNYFLSTFNDYCFCDFNGNILGNIWKKIKGEMDYFFVPKKLINQYKQKILEDYKK
jgi:FkbM family methyltransferase